MSVFYLADKHVVEVYGDEALKLAVNGTELIPIDPNSVDAAKEKHVPVATYDGASHRVYHPRDEEGRSARQPHSDGCTRGDVPSCGRRCAGEGHRVLQPAWALADRVLRNLHREKAAAYSCDGFLPLCGVTRKNLSHFQSLPCIINLIKREWCSGL